ncbi:cAMP-mediated signaling protein sok1 [Mycoemilia scoparia]|uniref:cAMP-mediated signaling protein sok1 n=1 Tax=Mycoemilia scoparia TaxID=417184 RepID=A0A9W7ZTK7_9FUNG|nr:cAMP-mediated signaling protein sok1 [Mycoemilia scoparia]
MSNPYTTSDKEYFSYTHPPTSDAASTTTATTATTASAASSASHHHHHHHHHHHQRGVNESSEDISAVAATAAAVVAAVNAHNHSHNNHHRHRHHHHLHAMSVASSPSSATDSDRGNCDNGSNPASISRPLPSDTTTASNYAESCCDVCGPSESCSSSSPSLATKNACTFLDSASKSQNANTRVITTPSSAVPQTTTVSAFANKNHRHQISSSQSQTPTSSPETSPSATPKLSSTTTTITGLKRQRSDMPHSYPDGDHASKRRKGGVDSLRDQATFSDHHHGRLGNAETGVSPRGHKDIRCFGLFFGDIIDYSKKFVQTPPFSASSSMASSPGRLAVPKDLPHSVESSPENMVIMNIGIIDGGQDYVVPQSGKSTNSGRMGTTAATSVSQQGFSRLSTGHSKSASSPTHPEHQFIHPQSLPYNSDASGSPHSNSQVHTATWMQNGHGGDSSTPRCHTHKLPSHIEQASSPHGTACSSASCTETGGHIHRQCASPPLIHTNSGSQGFRSGSAAAASNVTSATTTAASAFGIDSANGVPTETKMAHPNFSGSKRGGNNRVRAATTATANTSGSKTQPSLTAQRGISDSASRSGAARCIDQSKASGNAPSSIGSSSRYAEQSSSTTHSAKSPPNTTVEPWARTLPPINRHTLRELDIRHILQNPRLRHEIVFEPKLEFRPNPSPEMTKYKDSMSWLYWSQLDKELRASGVFGPLHSSTATTPATDITSGSGVSGLAGNKGLVCWLVDLIIEIREILYEMLSDPEAESGIGVSLRTNIRTAHLRDEFSYTLENLPTIMEFILGVMTKLASPAMHSEIDQIRQFALQGDLAHALRICYDCLEKMKINMANQCIETFRPFMQATSVQFEQTHFKTVLHQQAPPLTHTIAWWRKAWEQEENKRRECLKATGESDNDKGNDTSASGKISAPAGLMGESQLVYEKAFKDLFLLDSAAKSNSGSSTGDSGNDTTSTSFPETFLLDQGRFVAYRKDLDNFCAAGSMFITFRGFFNAVAMSQKNNATTDSSQGKKKVLDIVKDKILTLLKEKTFFSVSSQTTAGVGTKTGGIGPLNLMVRDLVSELTAHIHIHTGIQLATEQISQLERLVVKAINPQDRVYQLVHKRIIETLFDTYKPASSREIHTPKVLVEVFRSSLSGCSLDLLTKLVAELWYKIEAIRSHHWLVFKDYYVQLRRTL